MSNVILIIPVLCQDEKNNFYWNQKHDSFLYKQKFDNENTEITWENKKITVSSSSTYENEIEMIWEDRKLENIKELENLKNQGRITKDEEITLKNNYPQEIILYEERVIVPKSIEKHI